MVDAGAAYLEVQQRMRSVVVGLSEAQLDRRVPACPAWTVRDLVAHHTGAIVDLCSGGLVELGRLDRLLDQHRDAEVAAQRDATTARQIAERRGRSIQDVIEEWDAATERIGPMLSGEVAFPETIGPMGGAIALNDVVVHEGDLHEALAIDPPPAVLATSLALGGYGFTLDLRVREAGLPALALAYDGKQRLYGEGAPAAVVTADRTTLVRMLASRLIPEEIGGLDWSGDPGPYLSVIPTYGPAHPG